MRNHIAAELAIVALTMLAGTGTAGFSEPADNLPARVVVFGATTLNLNPITPDVSTQQLAGPQAMLVESILRQQLDATIASGLSSVRGALLSRSPEHFRGGILDGLALLAAQQFVVKTYGTNSPEAADIAARIEWRQRRALLTVPFWAQRSVLQQRLSTERRADVRDGLLDDIKIATAVADHSFNLLRRRASRIPARAAVLPLFESVSLEQAIGEDRHAGLGFLLLDHRANLTETIASVREAASGSNPEQTLWNALRYGTPPPNPDLPAPTEDRVVLRSGEGPAAALHRAGYSWNEILAIIRYNEWSAAETRRLRPGTLIRIPSSMSHQTQQRSTAETLAAVNSAARTIGVEPDHLLWQLHFSRILYPHQPEIILALLRQETGGGTNHGKGRFHLDMNERQQEIFLAFCAQWGVDPFLLPVSAGAGAKGDTQFLPETWRANREYISAATGHAVPWPWNIADALAATNAFLAAAPGVYTLGPSRDSRTGRYADGLNLYFMGPQWRERLREKPSLTFYARAILQRAQTIRSTLLRYRLVEP